MHTKQPTARASLRVLHVLSSGARGGGSAHLLGLLPAMRAHDVECHALVGDDGPLGVQLTRAQIPCRQQPPVGRASWIQGARALSKHISRLSPAIVHAHGTRAACLLSVTKLFNRLRQPAVYTAHMSCSSAARGVLDARARRGVDRVACWQKQMVICVGPRDRARLLAEGTTGAARVVHVPNAVAPESFWRARAQRNAWRLALRARLNVPADTRLVVSVARLVRQKDVATLARAVARLPDVHLVVLGDGPEAGALRASALAQGGRLHLLGGRDDVAEHVVAADAFALSSAWESGGIVLLEAMAAGVPWVATATDGARDVHASSQAGTLCAIGDDRQLAAALQHSMTNDTAADVARGDAYVQTCRWPEVAGMHAHLYRTLRS